MGALTEVHDRLRGEWSMLESQWHSTRSAWRDSVGDSFEKEFWDEMKDGIPRYLRELQQVDDTLTQALNSLNSY